MNPRSAVSILFLSGLLLSGAVLAFEPNDAGVPVPEPNPGEVFTVPNACVTINGVLGGGSADWDSTTGTIPGYRIYRDGNPSSCAAPKSCPGTCCYTSCAFDAYAIFNTTGGELCVEADLNVAAEYLHLVAYLGAFDPSDICLNYLGDSGSSAGAGSTEGLSVTLPAGAGIVFVVHENNPGAGIGDSYLLTVNGACGGAFTPDLTLLDDLGRSELCIQKSNGMYQWTNADGSVYAGTGVVANGGTAFWTLPEDPTYIYATYDSRRKRARAYFTNSDDAVYNSLVDRNTANNPECGSLIEVEPPPVY